MAGAAANAANLRKQRLKKGKSNPDFQNPTRFGWGETAEILHPDIAKVGFSNIVGTMGL